MPPGDPRADRGVTRAAALRPLHGWLLAIYTAVLLWSAWHPKDGLTWALEVFPAIAGLAVIVATWRRFPLTDLVCVLILIHAVILMIGGHYTYAGMPLFNWLRDTFGLVRNNYDRVGHVAQGFVPAIVAREILLRVTPLRPGKMLFFLVTSICTAISAWYELLEWQVAVISGDRATAFLATQGDVWDTQWDMFLAFVSSMVAQWLLAGMHDRQLARLRRETIASSA